MPKLKSNADSIQTLLGITNVGQASHILYGEETLEAEHMPQQLGTLAAFPGDPHSAPSICVGQLCKEAHNHL